MALLEVDGIGAAYGRVRVLTDVSLHVDAGEIVTLIGANGAGKTTTLRAISGLVKLTSGAIRLEGRDLAKRTPDQIVRLGIGHAPEGRRVFARMTVRENLELGRVHAVVSKRIRRGLRTGSRCVPPPARTAASEERNALGWRAADARDRPRPDVAAEHLDARRAVVVGLSPILVQTIFGIIRDIASRGTTVLLIEQNARQALADRQPRLRARTGAHRCSRTPPRIS